ncbi:MAG: ABC transporter substrate-binding protein [Angustibacter sp.]
MRVVSLLPSATDICCALGLGDDLVGVTFECRPDDGRERTVVVGGRDTSGLPPAEIDAYVREQMAAGADLYTLHADALAELQPDLVLTQDLCRVCALPTDHVDEALAHLGCRADVLALDPHTLTEVLDTVLAVAAATGRTADGEALVSSLTARLNRVAAAVDGRARPRTAVVEWVDPPFGAGHWIPDLVDAAGGLPVFARPHEKSVPLTWDDLRAERPDVVLVAPCGFGTAGAVEQAAAVVDALPGVPVWALDGDALVVRPGPRVVEGVEVMASVLHPEVMGPPPAGSAVRVA